MAFKVVELESHIRWMIRKDMPQILEIEKASFSNPWTEEEFVQALRHRDTIGMVAECGDDVGGYMIYELHKNRLHLLSLAVHPSVRRKSLGRVMMERIMGKLSQDRRNRITLEVRESNLAAQLFFRQLGFRAVRILRDFYSDTTEDAYLMEYRYVGGFTF